MSQNVADKVTFFNADTYSRAADGKAIATRFDLNDEVATVELFDKEPKAKQKRMNQLMISWEKAKDLHDVFRCFGITKIMNLDPHPGTKTAYNTLHKKKSSWAMLMMMEKLLR